jgi:hypothetical protein
MLAMNFFPNAEAAVHEMRSVASPQGTISASVWDYSDGMRFLRHFWDAAAELDPWPGSWMKASASRFVAGML